MSNSGAKRLILDIHVSVKWGNIFLNRGNGHGNLLELFETHSAQNGSDVIE
jgi:hypothetical protein